MRRSWGVSAALLLLGVAAAAAAPAREDQIFMLGNLAGSQTVAQSSGATRAEYSFNDRGRGDHIVATWKLDAAGVPIEYHGSGNDYMKAPVSESFSLAGGKASWHNRAEQGEKQLSGAAFYVPVNGPPEMLGVLARALLKAPQHRLALLPAGEATIEPVGALPGQAEGAAAGLTQYQISGLDLSPTRIWLAPDGETAAVAAYWFSVLAPAAHGLMPRLLAAQDVADEAWSAGLRRARSSPRRRAVAPGDAGVP